MLQLRQLAISFFAVLLCLYAGLANAAITDGKYGVDQVFDVQRSPAFPTANTPITFSRLSTPLKDGRIPYTLGEGEYIQFFYVVGGCADPASKVGIRRYDANDNLIETISSSGNIFGLVDGGFFTYPMMSVVRIIGPLERLY